jgi:hypothetical protein
MLFDGLLDKYLLAGSFSFKPSESLSDKCNAPEDKAGIYLIFKVIKKKEILIYIGASGQKTSKGILKVRKGGIYDRLINGYHPNRFGEIKRIKRSKAFPNQMLKENIPEIKIYWWVTHNDNYLDFPTDVEAFLMKIYRDTFEALPDWHNKLEHL